jgi:hypothetical protein
MLSKLIDAWLKWADNGEVECLETSLNEVMPLIADMKMPTLSSSTLENITSPVEAQKEKERILAAIEEKIKEEMTYIHDDEEWVDEICEENAWEPYYEDQIKQEYEEMMEYQKACRMSWFGEEIYEKLERLEEEEKISTNASVMKPLERIRQSSRYVCFGEEILDPEDIIKPAHHVISTEERIRRALLRRRKRRQKIKEKVKLIGAKIAGGQSVNNEEKEFWFKFKKRGRNKVKNKTSLGKSLEEPVKNVVNLKTKKPPDKPTKKRTKLLVSQLYQTITRKVVVPKRKNMPCNDNIINTEVCSILVKCKDVLEFLV